MLRIEVTSDITEVLSEIPNGYHESRRKWWSTNAPFWATYLDATPSRKELLLAQAERARDICKAHSSSRVVDCGCGEGMFLRLLERMMVGSHLSGIDFCESMIAKAKQRSLTKPICFEQVDLEVPSTKALGVFDLAVASLVLDEVEDLNRALECISELIMHGGHLLLIVLDAEAERQKLVSASEPPDFAYREDQPLPLLVLKRFRIGPRPSPAPYCRVLRSSDAYVSAAEQVGLECVKIEPWTPSNSSDGTVYKFILFSKTQEF